MDLQNNFTKKSRDSQIISKPFPSHGTTNFEPLFCAIFLSCGNANNRFSWPLRPGEMFRFSGQLPAILNYNLQITN